VTSKTYGLKRVDAMLRKEDVKAINKGVKRVLQVP